MAYTVSTTANNYMGIYRIKAFRVTADAATQNIDTGLGNISFAQVTPVSSSVWISYTNSGAGGTSLAGIIGVSGATSGDVCDIVCFGHD